MIRPAWILVFMAMVLPPAATTAYADILHLRSGSAIDTTDWWVEGETLHYESGAGTVGIPRSEVVRIERSGGSGKPSIRIIDRDPDWPREQGDESITEMTQDEYLEVKELMERGNGALEVRDFDGAASAFMAVLREQPRISAARVGYAVSAIAMDRDSLALSIILEGLAIDPGEANFHELLGDLRNREERVEDAVASWKDAFRISPNDRLREKITKGERELHAGRYYSFTTSPHFNVRYGEDLDPSLGAEVTDRLEQQYWKVAGALNHAPQQPITVLLYPEKEFRDVTLAPESVLGIYDGKIRVPLGGIRKIDSRASALLIHELTHAIIHSKTRGNCPRWLHEGLAQLFEDRPSTEGTRKEVARVLEGIKPSDWDANGLSYPAALSLTRFLEAIHGLGGLVRVLDRLGEGDGIEEALQSVYSDSYVRLCSRWAANVVREEER